MGGAEKKIAWFSLLVMWSSPGFSQQNQFVFEDTVSQWSKETGVAVTASAKAAAVQEVALVIGAEALSAGIDATTAAQFVEAYKESGLFVVSHDGLIISKGAFGEVSLPYTDKLKSEEVEKQVTYEFVAFRLRKLPTIIVKVTPVPPLDYIVQINDEVVETTKESVYAVNPGTVSVRVKRAGKQDCEWRGQLQIGDERPVSCSM